MKTIKFCIGLATFCVVFLTSIASYLLVSNFDTIDSRVAITAEQCDFLPNNANNTAASSNEFNNKTDTSPTKGVAADNRFLNSDNYKGLLDSIVYNVTLAVNSVNNVITSGSIFIGIITLFIAIVGLFGYHHLKEDINKYSSVFEKTKELVESADGLKKSLVAQQTYIDKSNESLMKTVYAIANHIQDKEIAKDLLKQQSHIAEIINLYRPCINPKDLADVSNKKKASLLYLQENGTSDDLPDLEHVLENDPDPDVRAKAQKVIIIIKSGVPSAETGCCLTRVKNWLRNL